MIAKTRKCKQCGVKSAMEKAIRINLKWFCDYDCATSWAKEKAITSYAKERKQKNAKFKSDFYDNDVKTRKAAAKKACHAFIRYRDRNDSCICCDLKLGDKFDAGHFLESGNNSFLRYHADNIHGQSVHCNQYKGGDSGDYERNLRKKIGDARVDYLLANKGGIVKRTAKDYRDIQDDYELRLKRLKDSA
jgi:hypothetical protein